jgi:hypothetical protein
VAIATKPTNEIITSFNVDRSTRKFVERIVKEWFQQIAQKGLKH